MTSPYAAGRDAPAGSASLPHPCEGWKRYAIRCSRTTLHPSRTCHDHRNQAGHGFTLWGHDAEGEWRVYTFSTPTGWGITLFRVINGGDYGCRARVRYVKRLAHALEVRDRWAAALSEQVAA